MSLVVKYSETKSVPEGIYVVKLTKLEPTTHPQWGDSIRWTFDISEGDHTGTAVTAMSSTKVSPKSKIFGWVQAFGHLMDPGEEFDLTQLIGKTVRARIINKKQSKVVDGRSVEMTFSNVDALAPYTKKSGQSETPSTPPQSSPPQTPPQDEGFDNIPGGSDELEDDQDFNF